MLQAATQELWREGSFEVVNATDISNRCGIESGPLVFRYEVKLCVEAGSLDGRGFILDNRAVNLYWCEKWGSTEPKTLPSCEEVVGIAFHDFSNLCEKEGVSLKGLEVRVYGGSYSAVTLRGGEVAASNPHPAFGAATPAPLREEIEAGAPVLEHLSEVVH